MHLAMMCLHDKEQEKKSTPQTEKMDAGSNFDSSYFIQDSGRQLSYSSTILSGLKSLEDYD